MLDATGEERAELLDIVARPVVRSLAGTGAQVSYSTESRALSLHYRPTLDLPTEIIIPQWSHGEDLEALEIQVQGACIDFQGNRLLLQAQEDAAEITLMLSP
jgi:hypothetical protein